MDRNVCERLERHLCDVLKEYADGGIKSPSDVETVKHALSGIVKLKSLGMIDEYNSGSGGYSRVSKNDNGMREKLERLMMEAGSEHDRRMISDMLGKM